MERRDMDIGAVGYGKDVMWNIPFGLWKSKFRMWKRIWNIKFRI
jgi:hypothetical protein